MVHKCVFSVSRFRQRIIFPSQAAIFLFVGIVEVARMHTGLRPRAVVFNPQVFRGSVPAKPRHQDVKFSSPYLSRSDAKWALAWVRAGNRCSAERR